MKKCKRSSLFCLVAKNLIPKKYFPKNQIFESFFFHKKTKDNIIFVGRKMESQK
jgi:hypothetical protein